ncbi:recombination mediator RecR [Peptoniphilus sp. KCTC 25270]|uniref:recombination mediator RecR n=1 Tax=Peptoniphilus sp. KCTC 25270 TaxID=2897414 RepID=UPI001E2F8EDE|nr:recombination mediator RecR [Peptoniphilus sp. KCTC 25270]MCD1146883.1 recombination mediator RecR [Peptoniphilus sp. KCTC 25270]
MNLDQKPLEALIHELSRLPGVGEKSAQRLTYYLLEREEEEVEKLASAILTAKREIKECPVCCSYTDQTPCSICSNSHRDHSTICVVESPRDVLAMERTGKYNGLYHVLHGTIIPDRGVLPNQLRIKELLERLKSDEIKEVILATNPTKNGDTTALYLAKTLEPIDVRVTRIAQGIPFGGDIEYYDEITVATALDHRTEFRSY